MELPSRRLPILEEMQQRIDELVEEVKARDAFIAFAGHELRNPITPVIGQVELLLSAVKMGRCPPEQFEQRLARIEHIVRHYVKRATVLLDVSRIIKGQIQFELASFDLVTLMHDIVGSFTGQVERAGFAITVTAPETLPGVWDRMAMEQIVENLISNAIRYGARTPVELSVERRGEQVRLQVRDYGSGVPIQERERILGRFGRAAGRNERRSGFGVGLWVVCQLAGAMGGTIAIEDAPGGGALFTVTLPRQVQGPCP